MIDLEGGERREAIVELCDVVSVVLEVLGQEAAVQWVVVHDGDVTWTSLQRDPLCRTQSLSRRRRGEQSSLSWSPTWCCPADVVASVVPADDDPPLGSREAARTPPPPRPHRVPRATDGARSGSSPSPQHVATSRRSRPRRGRRPARRAGSRARGDDRRRGPGARDRLPGGGSRRRRSGGAVRAPRARGRRGTSARRG